MSFSELSQVFSSAALGNDTSSLKPDDLDKNISEVHESAFVFQPNFVMVSSKTIETPQQVVAQFAAPVLAGDMNRNGHLDIGDVDAFALGLLDAQAYQTKYSVSPNVHGSPDGSIDFNDIGWFVNIMNEAGVSLPAETQTQVQQQQQQQQVQEGSFAAGGGGSGIPVTESTVIEKAVKLVIADEQKYATGEAAFTLGGVNVVYGKETDDNIMLGRMTPAADATQDGRVDGADFLSWQRNFGKTGPNFADTNGDGIVDGTDLLLIKNAFGQPAQYSETTTLAKQVVQAYAGNDVIHGASSSDTLGGGNDSDRIYGYSGNDKLYGDAGNDILVGGKGNDLLNGGSGADTFVYEKATTFGFVDTIDYFDPAEGDKIDLSDVLSSYDHLTNSIRDFIQVKWDFNKNEVTIAVDADGAGGNAAMQNILVLTNSRNFFSSNPEDMVTDGMLIV